METPTGGNVFVSRPRPPLFMTFMVFSFCHASMDIELELEYVSVIHMADGRELL
jgi:hypothetical protein